MGLGASQHKGGGGRGRGEDGVQVPACADRAGGSAIVQTSLAVQVEDKNDAFGLRQDRCPEGMGSGWSCGLGSVPAASRLPRGHQVPTLEPVVVSYKGQGCSQFQVKDLERLSYPGLSG